MYLVKKVLLLLMISLTLEAQNLFDQFIESEDSQGFLRGLSDYSHTLHSSTIEELSDLRNRYERFKGIEDGSYQGSLEKKEKIPKIIHLIWLGDKDFPPASVPNLRSIIDHHPDYQIVFWTDRKRTFRRLEPRYESKMVFKGLEEIDAILDTDPTCKKLFHQSVSYGEKSDILYFLILYCIGGVTFDHDVEVFRSFDPIVDQLSFFCFCDRLYGMVLRQYVKFNTCVIGSHKGNRILKKTLDILKSNWSKWDEIFDQINVHLRLRNNYHYSQNKGLYNHSVFLKSYIPFTLAVKEITLADDEVVLPPQMILYQRTMRYEKPFGRHKTACAWMQ